MNKWSKPFWWENFSRVPHQEIILNCIKYIRNIEHDSLSWLGIHIRMRASVVPAYFFLHLVFLLQYFSVLALHLIDYTIPRPWVLMAFFRNMFSSLVFLILSFLTYAFVDSCIILIYVLFWLHLDSLLLPSKSLSFVQSYVLEGLMSLCVLR